MDLFSDFGLLSTIQDTLKEKNIFKPTEIQAKAIPLLLAGKSIVGVSETGSGKTLTYALPLIHIIKSMELDGNPVTEPNSPRAIVMLPTRDLGEQVSKVFKTLTHNTRLRARPALGGMAMEQARRNVSSPFEILLATPGRLVQLIEMKLINLSDVRTLIFDEADQMLDQGFLHQSQLIAEACPKDIQLSLFSATVSTAVQNLMNTLFSTAEVIRSAGSGKIVQTLVTQNMIVKDGKRWPLFEKIIAKKVVGGTLIFTNTREQCDKLASELTEKGFLCAIYRGEMEKSDRRTNLKKFREGTIDILISTDLASRGLDLEHVGRVINFHLPQQLENYIHRVGRTARAGRSGLVINLVTERDQRLISRLETMKSSQFDGDDMDFLASKSKAKTKAKFENKNKLTRADFRTKVNGKYLKPGKSNTPDAADYLAKSTSGNSSKSSPAKSSPSGSYSSAYPSQSATTKSASAHSSKTYSAKGKSDSAPSKPKSKTYEKPAFKKDGHAKRTEQRRK